MTRSLRTLFLCAVAYAAFAAPAAAEDLGAWGDGVEVMQDAEMSDLRGGLAIAPGLVVNFGAVVTTYMDGAPILTTTLSWTEFGAVMRQTFGSMGTRISDLSPEALAALGLDGLGGLDGIVIDDENGVTALVHNLTEGSMQNIIINNATGRDLHQEIDITLEMPGFEALQAGYLLDRFGMQLNDDMRGVTFD